MSPFPGLTKNNLDSVAIVKFNRLNIYLVISVFVTFIYPPVGGEEKWKKNREMGIVNTSHFEGFELTTRN